MNYVQNRNRSTDFENNLNGYQRGQVGDGWDGLGVWDWCVHTEVYEMTAPWGPALQHRELYPISCDNLNVK